MTRASGVTGLLLGGMLLVLGFLGIRDGSTTLAVSWFAGTLLVWLTAVQTHRGSAKAQGIMSLLGLLLLARLLPIHFQSGLSWPVLAAIIFASITFGLGILGILLDRYSTS